MTTSRRTAIVVGILFLVAYVGIFVGGAISAPGLDPTEYPANLEANRIQVIVGFLVEVLLNDAAVIGIAVLLYPILKKTSQGMALALVGARFMEAALLILGKVGVLSVVELSQSALVGPPDGPLLQAFGESALAARHWSGQLSTVFFILGAFIFYGLLYRSRLVPRWVSGWGLIAVTALTLANVLRVPDPTQTFEAAMILYFPIMVSELLIAVWLIAKGFSQAETEGR